MKLLVDLDLCEGHGACVAAAPEIFKLDDSDETVALLLAEPPEELRARALEAVEFCPMAALQLEG